MHDRYGLPLSTESLAAAEAYNEGVDRFLAGAASAEALLRKAGRADPDFALARATLARHLQIRGDFQAANKTFQDALSLADKVSQREAGHLACLSCLFDGRTREAPAKITRHLAEYPLDAQILQPMAGVFGLVAFSGQPDTSRKVLEYVERYADFYQDDWWYQSALAFALAETGRLDEAEDLIRASLEACPFNAQGVHVRTHIAYERGHVESGYRQLYDFWRTYAKDGLIHSHLGWHLALWAMAKGDTGQAWHFYDEALIEPSSAAPPLNVLSDACSFLLRARLAGQEIPTEQWQKVSDYGRSHFPKPGLNFADLHCIIAHAMAGNRERCRFYAEAGKGPACDLLAPAARAFSAFAHCNWQDVIHELQEIMPQHVRLGGSNAQRDLLELTSAVALKESGAGGRARRFISSRRPRLYPAMCSFLKDS